MENLGQSTAFGTLNRYAFGVVIEAEFKAAARADHVCGTALFVVRRLLQARISANGTDKFLLAHDDGFCHSFLFVAKIHFL